MSAERQRSEQVARDRAESARRSEATEWRSRLTRIIPPHDSDTFYPQGRLECPYVRVFAPERMPVERFDPRDLRSMAMLHNVQLEIVPIVAKQMAMVLPNGAKVVWWTWEMGR